MIIHKLVIALVGIALVFDLFENFLTNGQGIITQGRQIRQKKCILQIPGWNLFLCRVGADGLRQ